MSNQIYDREIYSVISESKLMSFMMILIGLFMIALAVIFPDPPKEPIAREGLRAFIILIAFVTFIFTPRYKTSFRESGVVISVGYIPVIKVRLDRNKITHVGLIEWNPLKDFGGSGIKGGFGKFRGYLCFNVIGGRGIEIRTTEKNYVIEMGNMDRKRLLSMIGNYARAKV